ncbi:VC0807 family protein [Kutzneria sp. CA-103260]|uniref:VC0807 family protein n=1 Tax=Kutzneria sp. CA-103260 TaxID=2802641 RepID=UPI00273A35CE|nr:VC0807 family protein [Kutzneria sp. CA-103260]
MKQEAAAAKQDGATGKRSGSGLGSTLLELVLSIGLYYLLRAFGVDVFWALTAPAMAVGATAAWFTVRRGRLDMIGVLVLCELAVTIVTAAATRSPLVAALREPAYFLLGGVFCLVTLLHRVPFGHAVTATLATFGDPKREKAFERAWREEPRYRFWQRTITVAYGVIMVASAAIRAWALITAADLAHGVDVSNEIGMEAIGMLVVAGAILVQPPKKVIERLLAEPRGRE